MAKRSIYSADAVSGVATVKVSNIDRQFQFTILTDLDSNNSSTCTGTGTVTARVPDSDVFETVYNSSGAALTADLSAGVQTFIIDGIYDRIRVSSSESSDVFAVAVR